MSDTRVYQIISLVFGYRESDFKIAAVPVNTELTEYSEPLEIGIGEVKTIKYRKREDTLEMTFVERGRNSIYFSFSDVEKDSKSVECQSGRGAAEGYGVSGKIPGRNAVRAPIRENAVHRDKHGGHKLKKRRSPGQIWI